MPTDYSDGRGDLWWLALEKVIVKVNALSVKIDGEQRRLRCGTPAEKDAAFHAVYWWLRGIDEATARALRARPVQRRRLRPRTPCAPIS